MNTPPQPPNPRMTWVDQQNRYWRVERVGPRWQLSLYRPAVEAWQRVGPGRPAARRSKPPPTTTSPGDGLGRGHRRGHHGRDRCRRMAVVA